VNSEGFIFPTLNTPSDGVSGSTDLSRRAFLALSSALTAGGWLAAASTLTALAACAREAAREGLPWTTLTDPQAAALAAFARQILPPGDGFPGADEAGAVHFIDRALAGPFAGLRDLIAQGAADLDARAAATTPPAPSFSLLLPDAQVAILQSIEAEPFFGAARMLTLVGVFADPSWGGNRDGVGSTLLQIQHAPTYQPPFGYYDAEYTASAGGA
jgi:hypothetical protein